MRLGPIARPSASFRTQDLNRLNENISYFEQTLSSKVHDGRARKHSEGYKKLNHCRTFLVMMMLMHSREAKLPFGFDL